MRRRSIPLLSLALLTLLPLGSPLQAQQSRGRDGVTVAAYAGAYLPGEVDFQTGENTFAVDDGRATFGWRLGYAFGFNLFVEGSAGYAPLRVATVDGLRNVNTFIFTGALGYNLQLLPSLQAYLLAGGGVTQWLATGLTADKAGEGVFGGGLRVYLTPGLSLGAEVRDHIAGKTMDRLRRDLNPGLDLPSSVTHNLEITASLGVFLGVNRDRDKDHVVDRYDNCPATPTGVRADAYGCPLDGDADGVADNLDRCPATPVGIAVDPAGCPLDRDADGVTDDVDRCPATPHNVSVDPDGCPRDGDGDGVFSGLDLCPNTPAGALVDESGCPLDGDEDGVPDGLDRCPNTPAGGEVNEEGCSVIQAGLEKGHLVLSSIYFQTNSAQLLRDSQRVLDEVGQALLDRAGVRVEIQGHTDSTGPAAYNLRLSEARAQAVLDYLLSRFPVLDRRQFVVQGYGELRPIASNDTADGRSMNRRVEFVVLESQ